MCDSGYAIARVYVSYIYIIDLFRLLNFAYHDIQSHILICPIVSEINVLWDIENSFRHKFRHC